MDIDGAPELDEDWEEVNLLNANRKTDMKLLVLHEGNQLDDLKNGYAVVVDGLVPFR